MFSKWWEVSHSFNVFSAHKIIKTMWAVKEDWRHKITYKLRTATLLMKYKQLFYRLCHKIREHVSWKEDSGHKYHTKSESSNTVIKVPYRMCNLPAASHGRGLYYHCSGFRVQKWGTQPRLWATNPIPTTEGRIPSLLTVWILEAAVIFCLSARVLHLSYILYVGPRIYLYVINLNIIRCQDYASLLVCTGLIENQYYTE